jgi:hypothetical protein
VVLLQRATRRHAPADDLVGIIDHNLRLEQHTATNTRRQVCVCSAKHTP